MQECFGYNIEKLLQALPRFELREIPVVHKSEDDSRQVVEYYFTKKNDIKRIEYWYGFGKSMSVYCNEIKHVLYESNVTINGTIPLRMNENNFISPKLKINSEFVESTPELVIWLKFNKVPETAMRNAMQSFKLYSTIEYPGVPTPQLSHGYWGYSSENLKLHEKEIETVLNGIDDELLRKKIECILYARVFKN